MSLLRPISTLMLASLALAATSAASDSEVGPVTPAGDDSIRATLRLVAHHQMRPLRDGDYAPVTTLDALRAATAPQGIRWNYPWGVTLYGVLRSSDVTGDTAASDFVLEHNRIVARYHGFLGSARSTLGAGAFKPFRNPIGQLMNLGHLDSCGAMGVQFLEGLLRHPDSETPEHKQVVARIADWIVHGQDRLPDGTLWREKTDGGATGHTPGTIWQDDLYMACPFLVRWARYTGDSRHLDDAVRQILAQAALLQDADGVWFHAYFVHERLHSPFKWGRANGWGVVATVEVLSALPENHPSRPALLALLRRHLEGIKRLQAPSGLWHQVLDHPELWEETSCSAMFAYGIARAVNRGWIDASNLDAARRAFAGIQTRVTADGAVNGTCEGTNIGFDLDYYASRPRPDDDLHGRGAVLLAGAEILAARK